MALGGVATGNMKAYEQVTAAGNISDSGLMPIISACINIKIYKGMDWIFLAGFKLPRLHKSIGTQVAIIWLNYWIWCDDDEKCGIISTFTISARIGRRMLAVAVLEATSVIVAVMMQMMSIMAKGGSTSKWVSRRPSHTDSPDAFEASDNAKPAPVDCQLRLLLGTDW